MFCYPVHVTYYISFCDVSSSTLESTLYIIYFIVVVNKRDYMYIKTLAAQQGCKTLTVACLKHKTI